MEHNEIIKNNILIAEFIGYDSFSFDGHTIFIVEDAQHVTETDLNYHKSWDWLMLAVEKINEIQYNRFLLTIGYEHCTIEDEQSNIPTIDKHDFNTINAVYNCVIEFIKQYNQQNITNENT